MREIKFRGLTTGEAPTWVYGSLVNNLWAYSELSKHPKGTPVTQIVITGEADDWQAVEDNELVVDVLPRSVGQYTGLKDKNGKEIYEGDLVKCGYGMGKVVFGGGCFMVEWLDDKEAMMEFLAIGRDNVHNRRNDEQFEVIGNIYETPLPVNTKAPGG
jgi:uncharacterized phage protein (TIGR01671 family)